MTFVSLIAFCEIYGFLSVTAEFHVDSHVNESTLTSDSESRKMIVNQ